MSSSKSGRSRARTFFVNVLQTLLIYGLTTLLAYVVDISNIQSDAIKMLYLVGVLLISLQTNDFLLTTLASLMFAATDAILINPDEFHRQSFILSTIIFLLIALIITMLSSRLQNQIDRSKRNELAHKRLYQASQGLISVRGDENILEYANESLTHLIGSPSEVFFDIPKNDPDKAKRWCFKNSAICGHDEVDFPDEDCKYYPIRSNRKTIGVAAVDCSDLTMTRTMEECILSFLSQLALAVERNALEERNKKESAIFAREKIKGTVMKRLSNDMYPRIGTIQSVAEELQDQEPDDPEERNARYRTIGKEASYLADTVDNLVEITTQK